MTFEVDFTVVENDEHISVRTAWINASNVTECKELAAEVAESIPSTNKEICMHIGELML